MSSQREWAALLGLIFAGLATAAHADNERWDHRGSMSLLVAPGVEYVSSLTTTNIGTAGRDVGLRFAGTLGGTVALNEHWEAVAQARVALGGPVVGLGFQGGLRSIFGLDRWKTMLEGTLSVRVLPFFTIGARAGFGVQYELSEVIGVYVLAGAELAGGAALRLGFEASVGLQFRTYVFDP